MSAVFVLHKIELSVTLLKSPSLCFEKSTLLISLFFLFCVFAFFAALFSEKPLKSSFD
jgi:hypothetical protein